VLTSLTMRRHLGDKLTRRPRCRLYSVVRATLLESARAAHVLSSSGGASASALLAASISTIVVVTVRHQRRLALLLPRQS